MKNRTPDKKNKPREVMRTTKKNVTTKINMEAIIRWNLLSSDRLPKPIVVNKGLYHTGDTIRFSLSHYETPIFNYTNNRVENGEDIRKRPIYASVEGIQGTLFLPCSWSEKEQCFEVQIPPNAASGVVVMIMPVMEKNAEIHLEKGKICEDSSHIKKSSLSTPHPNYYQWVPVIITYVRITCGRCMNPQLSICPHGAILFDPDGYCYVDNQICKGQKRTVANSITDYQEEICWECFPAGETGAYSTKCTYQILQKALWMDYDCCGCCGEWATKTPNVCLKQWCMNQAILGGQACDRCPDQRAGEPPPGDPYSSGYYSDPSRCVGCMLCYNNIICKTPQMKAYIGRYKEVISILRFIDWDINFKNLPPLNSLQLALCIWSEQKRKNFMDLIPIKLSANQHAVINKEIQRDGDMHLALVGITRNRNLVLLGSNIRPGIAVIKATSNPPLRQQSIFQTWFGQFALVMEHQR